VSDYNLYSRVKPLPERQDHLPRPHIDLLMEEAVTHPLVTVVAGAGYGKTRAVSSFLKAEWENVAWFQFSTLDNLPSRWWEKFVYAIAPMNVVSEQLLSLGFPETLADFDQFLRIFSGEIAKKKAFIIVFDDFYLIREKSILSFIENLIAARLPKTCMILISRKFPKLNLTKMLEENALYSIKEEDLRFSRGEIAEYYHMLDVTLEEGDIDKIHAQTAGWIFAIYLIGLSLKKGGNALSAATSDIFNLIDEEIFSVCSEELKHLLVKISLLDNLPVGLVLELTDNDSLIMAEIIKSSQFIRYDSYVKSYNIHPLFRDFLRERQFVLKQDEIEELHLCAARWYAANDYKIDAILHYRASGHYNEVFDLVLTYSTRCTKQMTEFLIRVIDEAPPKALEERPVMRVVRCIKRINNFLVDEAFEELSSMRAEYEAMPRTGGNKAILGEVYIALALHSILKKTYDFIELFKMANEYLPSGSAIIKHTLQLNGGNFAVPVAEPEPGAFERYVEALFECIPYMTRVMNGAGYGVEFLCATETAYFMKDFKKAQISAFQAIAKARQQRQIDIEIMANFYLLRIYMAQGSYTKAVSLLKRVRIHLEEQTNATYLHMLDVAEGWFYASIGQTHLVAHWILNEDKTGTVFSPISLGLDWIVRARALMADKKYFEVLALTDQMKNLYGVASFLLGKIKIQIFQAVAQYNIGDRREAMQSLQSAYDLSYANQLIMPFIELGSSMRTLIQASRQDENCSIPDQWQDMIQKKSATYAKQVSQVAAAYKLAHRLEAGPEHGLTKREIQILSDLCHGLTREEIADNNNLSVNTVRSILQGICNKLGATNTIDAVRIATLMKLNL